MRFGSLTAARRRSTSSCVRTFATARSRASSSRTCTATTYSVSPVSSARSAAAARRRDACTARTRSRCISSALRASAISSEPPSRVREPSWDSRSWSPSSPRPETASRASAPARTPTRAGSIDRCTSRRTADVACFSANGGPITAPRRAGLPKRRRVERRARRRVGAPALDRTPRTFEELGRVSRRRRGRHRRSRGAAATPRAVFRIRRRRARPVGTHGRRESHRAGTPPGPGV